MLIKINLNHIDNNNNTNEIFWIHIVNICQILFIYYNYISESKNIGNVSHYILHDDKC